MPNHIDNFLVIEGEKEFIDEMWRKFSTLLIDEHGEEYIRFPDFDKIIPEPNYEEKENQQSDFPDWYNWRIKNWGTKWNSYTCVEINEENIPKFLKLTYRTEIPNKFFDSKSNIFFFQTAWSTVPNIIEQMANCFPQLTFTCYYADEDTSYNCGYYEFADGKLTHCHSFEGGSKEAYEFSFLLNPDLKEYYFLNGETYTIREDT